jgi:hypothetical protein
LIRHARLVIWPFLLCGALSSVVACNHEFKENSGNVQECVH